MGRLACSSIEWNSRSTSPGTEAAAAAEGQKEVTKGSTAGGGEAGVIIENRGQVTGHIRSVVDLLTVSSISSAVPFNMVEKTDRIQPQKSLKNCMSCTQYSSTSSLYSQWSHITVFSRCGVRTNSHQGLICAARPVAIHPHSFFLTAG